AGDRLLGGPGARLERQDVVGLAQVGAEPHAGAGLAVTLVHAQGQEGRLGGAGLAGEKERNREGAQGKQPEDSKGHGRISNGGSVIENLTKGTTCWSKEAARFPHRHSAGRCIPEHRSGSFSPRQAKWHYAATADGAGSVRGGGRFLAGR